MKIIDQSAKILFPATKEEALRQLRLVEYAGRNCYRTQDKITADSYKSFIERLMKRGHGSPLEFGTMTVELIVGRDVLAEITRHRIASFAVQSQRYVNDSKDGEISFIKPNFYVPVDGDKVDAKDWCASRVWENQMRGIEKDYNYLRTTCGLSNEDARVILPNSTKTVIEMSANFREWLHVFALRTSVRAYPKMREAMEMVRAEAVKVIPFIFNNDSVEMAEQIVNKGEEK